MKRGGLLVVATTLAVATANSPTRANDDAAKEDVSKPAMVRVSQTAEGIINAPLRDVWAVFSTAEGFKKLGVAKCEMDFRIGGLIRSHYSPQGEIGDEGTIHNEILSYEPQRMMSFRIQKTPKGFPFAESTWKSTWNVATFTDLGDGRTHLRLTGMGYPDTEDGRKMRDFFESGNNWTIRHLQTQFDASVTPSSAAAHAPTPLAPIILERVVDLPKTDVWQFISSAEGWQRILGANANIELRPGGKFELLFDSKALEGRQGSEGCNVLSFIPNQMLSYTWNAPPKFEHARPLRTFVVIHLDELTPARTRVRLHHRGFAEQAEEHPEHKDEWEQVRAYFQRAWGLVLDSVKAQEGKQQ